MGGCGRVIAERSLDMLMLVYVAHPISGDVARNCALVEEKCSRIYKERPSVIPLAPYLMALRYLDDSIPEDRLRGIEGNKEFFLRHVIDEVWLFGDRLSAGMAEEVGWARTLNIPVIPMTDEVHADLLEHELEAGSPVQVCGVGPSAPSTGIYHGLFPDRRGVHLWVGGRMQEVYWGDLSMLAPTGVPVHSPLNPYKFH